MHVIRYVRLHFASSKRQTTREGGTQSYGPLCIEQKLRDSAGFMRHVQNAQIDIPLRTNRTVRGSRGRQ